MLDNLLLAGLYSIQIIAEVRLNFEMFCKKEIIKFVFPLNFCDAFFINII